LHSFSPWDEELRGLGRSVGGGWGEQRPRILEQRRGGAGSRGKLAPWWRKLLWKLLRKRKGQQRIQVAERRDVAAALSPKDGETGTERGHTLFKKSADRVPDTLNLDLESQPDSGAAVEVVFEN